ncbi:hypothetical protein [Roseibium sediminis]|uniref:hypothetical protein n=1 Tax=Roseibium sediminis TaxID=1775174 RepID=UPI00186482B5|nr:hypothetical protein [Roseibium sediminis]
MTNMFKIAGAAFLMAGTLAGGAVAQDQGTTRIIHSEPYGAVVTSESGVLVFRALPATERVIVNPDGKTPLTFNTTQVNEVNTYVGPKVMKRSGERWVRR